MSDKDINPKIEIDISKNEIDINIDLKKDETNPVKVATPQFHYSPYYDAERSDFVFIDTYDGPKTPIQLCGWAGHHRPDILKAAQAQITFPRLKIVGAQPVRGEVQAMLWRVGRKILGADTPNYAQEIGDP